MPVTVPPATVVAHWNTLIEGLQTSALEFYSSVEQLVGRREVPEAKTSRVDWSEGGLHSAKREYLRLTRGRFSFDVCAAPFGTGFFVSWWLGEPRPSPLPPTIAAFVAFTLVVSVLANLVGGAAAFFLTLLLVLVGLWVVGAVLPESEWEVYIVVIPIIGWLFERFFRPMTYYRIDTALMFQEAVHQAVLEEIDRLTEAKGLRKLTDLERKPILKGFFRQ